MVPGLPDAVIRSLDHRKWRSRDIQVLQDREGVEVGEEELVRKHQG